MSNYTLYKHTFPNNKLYFGITCRPLIERWRKDGSGYRKNLSMWRAIKKYGWDNVKHDILFENLSEETANKLEQEYINKFNTTDRRFGYNIMPGGLVASGWHHSEESKKKMSEAQKGKHYIAEPWNKGKHYGKIKVYQYQLDGTFIAEFDSVYAASTALNIPSANIFDNINLRSKSCYGFIFSKFKSESMTYNGEPGAHKIIIYQYGRTGELLATYRSYKAVIEAINICESNLESCLAGRQKTAFGYVFSKKILSKAEVLEHYKIKKRKNKYKYLIINRETNEQIWYNNIDELAEILNISSTVLRNIFNGSYSKLTKKFIFKKELNNED